MCCATEEDMFVCLNWEARLIVSERGMKLNFERIHGWKEKLQGNAKNSQSTTTITMSSQPYLGLPIQVYIMNRIEIYIYASTIMYDRSATTHYDITAVGYRGTNITHQPVYSISLVLL